MKRSIRWIFLILLLAVSAALIWFLQLFVQVRDTMQFIEWDSSVQILEDGTSQDFSEDILSTSTDLTGTFRFTGTLPENLPSGALLFETGGLDISLTLNGNEIWNSHLSSLKNADLAQASIPLPENSHGELVFTCTILDGSNTFFPPLVRFLPTALETIQNTAFANRLAFPAGAAALSFVLVFGLFLLGLLQKKPDFSLLPLLAALLGLIAFRLILEQGYYFLPESVTRLLSHPGDRPFHFGSASFISGHEPSTSLLDILWNRCGYQRLCFYPLLSRVTPFRRKVCRHSRLDVGTADTGIL